jgi:hypothetical protein
VIKVGQQKSIPLKQALVTEVRLRCGAPKQARIIALPGPQPHITYGLAPNDLRRIDAVERRADRLAICGDVGRVGERASPREQTPLACRCHIR